METNQKKTGFVEKESEDLKKTFHRNLSNVI